MSMGALEANHLMDEELRSGMIAEVSEDETRVIEEAVRELLEGLGEDPNREGLRKTPLRVAKALRDATRGYKQNAMDIITGALFPEAGLENNIGHAGGVGGLVLVQDIDLFSYCESCLLPFQVKCHIGYVPSSERVLGLSKLSRVADIFAKRLQDPQRLANEICESLQDSIKPKGVAVILQCSHIDFPNFEPVLFDPSNNGMVKVLVKSGLGVFDNDKSDVWTDFLSLLRFHVINIENVQFNTSYEKSWCPMWEFTETEPCNAAMLSAVTSILTSLGDNPLRKELIDTPTRFVEWFVNFRNCNFDWKENGFVQHIRGSLTSNGDFSSSAHLSTELNYPFLSQCEHHLLPFHGVVHIGYFSHIHSIPVRKSFLPSIVNSFGYQLQVQERLTRQIAEAASVFVGEDVMVVVEASHTCMISRGVEKLGSSTSTIAVLGRFSTDSTARAKFMRIISNSRQNMLGARKG